MTDALNISVAPNGREALSAAAKAMNREIRLLDNFSMEYQDQRYQAVADGEVNIRRPDVEQFRYEQLASANRSIQRV